MQTWQSRLWHNTQLLLPKTRCVKITGAQKELCANQLATGNPFPIAWHKGVGTIAEHAVQEEQ